ncbi:TlpA disulfide reductase family protein [Bounagaea algeriensis]
MPPWSITAMKYSTSRRSTPRTVPPRSPGRHRCAQHIGVVTSSSAPERQLVTTPRTSACRRPLEAASLLREQDATEHDPAPARSWSTRRRAHERRAGADRMRGTFRASGPGNVLLRLARRGDTIFLQPARKPRHRRGLLRAQRDPARKGDHQGPVSGQALVLNVWGSWCGPCRAEMPELVEAAHATRDDPVQLLGVNVRDDQGAATDFLRNYDVPYPSLYDPSGKSMLAFDGIPLSVVPLTIVLDRHHRVAEVHLDTVSAEQLIPTLQRLATEQ